MRSTFVVLGAFLAALALSSCRVELEGGLEVYEPLAIINTKGETVQVEPGHYFVDVTAMRRPPRIRLEIYGLATDNVFDFKVEKFAGNKNSQTYVVPAEVTGQPFDVRYFTSTTRRTGDLVKKEESCSFSREVCGYDYDDGEYACVDTTLYGRRYVEYYPTTTYTIVEGEILNPENETTLASFESSKEDGTVRDYQFRGECVVSTNNNGWW